MLKSALVALLCACLLTTGCNTTHYIPYGNLQDEKAVALKPGQTVAATMKSGQVRKLEVTSVDRETITGRNLDTKGADTSVQIALADVQSLEVRKFSGGKTFLAVAGVIVGLAAVLFGAYVIACDNGGCSDE